MFKCNQKKINREKGGGPRTVHILFGFFLMINATLGTGFLSIPYVYFHGGILLEILTMLFITFLSWLCAIWVLETMARSQGVTDYEEALLSGSPGDFQPVSLTSREQKSTFRIIATRKFETSEMCELFGGRWVKVAYMLLLTIQSFLACVSYCSVAGSAWASSLPLNFGRLEECKSEDFKRLIIPEDGCLYAYRFCVFLFACIIIPLTLLSLKEQVVVQVGLGLLRFCAIGAIVLYCLIHLVQGHEMETCSDPNAKNTSTIINATLNFEEISFKFDIKGWLTSIPIFTYAHSLHSVIPSVSHPIRQKQWLGPFFHVLFVVLGVCYLLLGLMVSLWFRDCIIETCTLNWDPFTESRHTTALRVLSFFITIFPSIDVLSAFPLVVLTTVNNIYTVVLGKDTSQHKGWCYTLIHLGMKLLFASLPIGVSFFVANLVVILKYGGLIGFFIGFYFPVLLQLRSQWVCQEKFSHTLYDINLAIQAEENDSSSDIPEKTTLLSSSSVPFTKRLTIFLCGKDAPSYTTLYSLPILSSPIVVIITGIITASFLVVTIVGITIYK